MSDTEQACRTQLRQARAILEELSGHFALLEDATQKANEAFGRLRETMCELKATRAALKEEERRQAGAAYTATSSGSGLLLPGDYPRRVHHRVQSR